MDYLPSVNPAVEFLGKMHQLLSHRHDALALQRQYRGSRASNLALSKYKEVERAFASSVNVLDVSLGDGKFLLSGSGDGSVVIHGVTKPSSTVRETFPVVGKVSAKSPAAHEYAVSACQFYPHDPGVFVSSGKDGKVKIWDTHRMTPAHSFGFKLPVLNLNMSVIRSAKPLIAVACMDKNVYISDFRTLSASHTLEGHRGPVTCCRWAQHGAYLLASGAADGRILLWDVRKARSCLGYLDANGNSSTAVNADLVNVAHGKSVISVEFAEDTKHLVSYGADHQMRLWSTLSGKNLKIDYGRIEFEFRDVTRHLQLSLSSQTRPDLIFIPSGDKILVFNMLTGARISTLTGHFGQTLTCAYHPGRQYLFSGATDRNVLVWSPATDYRDLEEEEELKISHQLDRSAKRAAMQAFPSQLQMDTWSDDES